MKFWWVNQNQTFDQEVSGGYMWSPQRRSDGAFNQFYENMRLVEPGDVVFSFRDQLIACIGLILSVGYEAPQPPEFGDAGANWSRVGWRVDVQFSRLRNRVRPKSFIAELAPVLPSKYAPLTRDGNGLQSVYLAAVPDAMAAIVVHKIGPEADAILSGAKVQPDSMDGRGLVADRIEAIIANRPDIAETEKEALVKSRRGQGAFRIGVLLLEPICRVTGVGVPRFLIASHMKPWHRCNTNSERLDPENGLMLTPTPDYLFDRGLISFEDSGDLLVSSSLGIDDRIKLGLDGGILKRPFRQGQAHYLAYHRDQILLE